MNREFNEKKDKLKLDLKYGSNPSLTNGTAIIVDVDPSNKMKWSLVINASDSKNPEVTVTCPADAFIGRYKVALFMQSEVDGKTEVAIDEEPDIILLCNPWCQEDTVYLENEEERNEYVLNDTGKIWRGTTRSSHPCSWNFGQFEDQILDATLDLLEKDNRVKAKNGVKKMRDPVWLGRILSAAANSSDENGILVGNWSGKYENGVNPCSWSGSVRIIQQYIQTKQPVRFL